MTAKNDTYIYSRFLHAVEHKVSITDLANDLKVSRGHIYDVVRRLRNGNPAQVRVEVERARLNALWTYKYAPRYAALPKDRKPSTIRELRHIIRGMDKDSFSQVQIAAKLGKDRATIIHHLSK